MIKEASNPKIAQIKQYRGFDYQNQTMSIQNTQYNAPNIPISSLMAYPSGAPTSQMGAYNEQTGAPSMFLQPIQAKQAPNKENIDFINMPNISHTTNN